MVIIPFRVVVHLENELWCFCQKNWEPKKREPCRLKTVLIFRYLTQKKRKNKMDSSDPFGINFLYEEQSNALAGPIFDFSYLFEKKCCICGECPTTTTFSKTNFQGQTCLLRYCSHKKLVELNQEEKAVKSIKDLPCCHICGVTMSKLDTLRNHIQKVHALELIASACKACNKVVKDQTLHSHYFEHFDEVGLFKSKKTNPSLKNHVDCPSPDYDQISQDSALKLSDYHWTRWREHLKRKSIRSQKRDVNYFGNEDVAGYDAGPEFGGSQSQLVNNDPCSSSIAVGNVPTKVVVASNVEKSKKGPVVKQRARTFSQMIESQKSQAPFQPRQKKMYKWVMKYSVSKDCFEDLLKILPDSLLEPPPANHRVVNFNSYNDVSDISKRLQVPQPVESLHNSPIYHIRDYLSRLASKKEFWEKLVLSEDQTLPETNPKKKILEDLVKCDTFKRYSKVCKEQEAFPLLLNVFIDGFQMLRFSFDNSKCGIYSNVVNLSDSINSRVDDCFLNTLFSDKLSHNEYLEKIFEQFNELYEDGIVLEHPETGEKKKFIVFLHCLLADSPERADIVCNKHCTANQGCYHCKFDLKEGNFLVKPTARVKDVHYYLLVRDKVKEAANRGVTAVKDMQEKYGLAFYDTNQRDRDLKDEDVPLKDLEEYYRESPILKLKQFEDGLFTFDNIVIAPFHNVMMGVMNDLFIWFEEEGWFPKNWSDWNLKINLPAEKFTKRELDLLLKNSSFFERTLPQKMVNSWKKFSGVVCAAYFHEKQVSYHDFFEAKKDFFLCCQEKHASFLNKPNFHFIDHVIQQVGETGPIPCKSDNVGEGCHLILKKMKNHLFNVNNLFDVAARRMQKWIISLLDVK